MAKTGGTFTREFKGEGGRRYPVAPGDFAVTGPARGSRGRIMNTQGQGAFRGGLPFTFGLACLISLAGCDRGESKPEAQGNAMMEALDCLTPEGARAALIAMAEGGYEGLPRTGDGPSILRRLDMSEDVEAMKHIPPRGGHTDVWISDWYCRLRERDFERTLPLVGGHRYVIKGSFRPEQRGKWKASIESVSHVNTGPGFKP